MASRDTQQYHDPDTVVGGLGRCFVYVFPTAWEDHVKIGFSRDPLARLQQLHRRWFDVFDLDGGMLVETETVRDARRLELELRGPLVEHRAPVPSTIRVQAGGHTEWFRGAGAQLGLAAKSLADRGHVVHAPLRGWLRAALTSKSDLLHDWTAAQLSIDELEGLAGDTLAQRAVRDVLDAHAALAIDLPPLLPAEVLQWYDGRGGTR